MHRLRRCVSARRAAHQRHDRKGLHGLRRVLVLHALRGRLPDRGRDRQHSLPPEVTMSGPFESYDDLEDADERLQAADPAERRVAIIALGHSGDTTAVGHLANMVADPDAGVRQQLAMALGEFDGPESAAALVQLLVDPEQAVASAGADSIAEVKDTG